MAMNSKLRLQDLLHVRRVDQAKLMNMHVPVEIAERIDQITEEVGCTKTATIIALFNEGLDAFEQYRHEFPSAPLRRRRRTGRPPKY